VYETDAVLGDRLAKLWGKDAILTWTRNRDASVLLLIQPLLQTNMMEWWIKAEEYLLNAVSNKPTQTAVLEWFAGVLLAQPVNTSPYNAGARLRMELGYGRIESYEAGKHFALARFYEAMPLDHLEREIGNPPKRPDEAIQVFVDTCRVQRDRAKARE